MVNQDSSLDLKGIAASASDSIRTFAQETISKIHTHLESMVITGSCLTGDYIHGKSDINSVLILKEIALPVLDILASMGKRYGKKGVRAPLIMTQDYIHRSLDVFPIEFLDIKLIHKTIYGDDMFSSLDIDKSMLRLQCERDLKAKLINLRHGYISCVGKRGPLTLLLLDAFPGFFPLFRAMLYIVQLNKQPSLLKTEVLNDVEATFDVPLDALRELQAVKAKKKPSFSHEQANRIFNEVYRITNEFSFKMDMLFG